jgi:lysozyme family protein
MQYTYDNLKQEYEDLWSTMEVVRDFSTLQRLSDKIKQNKDKYMEVQRLSGVPWQMVAVIHVREAGELDIGRWKGVLHNGEKIIGTGRKTRLVPAGRGPFDDWVLAAVDALRLKGFDKITSWPISRILWALEPYNGYGYRNKGLRSPYLWASTNHQQKGKYVSDGVFDPNVVDTQIGCAALLKYLGVDVGKGPIIIGTSVSGAVAAGAAIWQWPNLLWWIGIPAILIVAGIVVYEWNKRKTNVVKN